MPDLKRILKVSIKACKQGTADDISRCVSLLRRLGITVNMHVGKNEEFFNHPRHKLEWIAGQYLDLIECRDVIPMSSFISYAEDFLSR